MSLPTLPPPATTPKQPKPVYWLDVVASISGAVVVVWHLNRHHSFSPIGFALMFGPYAIITVLAMTYRACNSAGTAVLLIAFAIVLSIGLYLLAEPQGYYSKGWNHFGIMLGVLLQYGISIIGAVCSPSSMVVWESVSSREAE